jgi:formylglycine-generating enzyme required for sulfatase activity
LGNEGPRHEVEISKAFYLGRTPVTVGQFKRFVEAKGYRTEAEKAGDDDTWKNPGFEQKDDHPVVWVSWNDADAYCKWLKKEIGAKEVRLPREAEWEYSCRAGSDKKYCFGDNKKDLGVYAWYKANTGYGTEPCGQKKANKFDLCDMHGLVWEWCLDGMRAYQDKAETDPEGPTSAGASRVFRGGSFIGGPRVCRAAARSGLAPSFRRASIGFRVFVPR